MASTKQDTPLDTQVLVVCAFVLYVKFLAATMEQSRRGFAAGTRMPEDSILPLAKGKSKPQSFIVHLNHPDEVIHNAVYDELR